jgi:hypothetical protein
MERRPELVCLVHGEDNESLSFAEYARERLGLRTFVPSRGHELDLDKLPAESYEPAAIDPSEIKLIEEILQLNEHTSDLSGRLARFRDMLEARLIDLDEKTADNLKTICSGICSEAKGLMGVLDELDIKGG